MPCPLLIVTQVTHGYLTPLMRWTSPGGIMDGVDPVEKRWLARRNNTINEEIQACERDLEKLSEASKSLDQIISRKHMVFSLLNWGYKDDKGFFYRDPPNPDDQSEEGAKRRQKEVATRRQRLYKDLGIKVFATREDSWVEIGGSTLYQNGNSS